MHELPIFLNITGALVATFIGGLIARRMNLPPIVGYLLAGMVIGPFTPKYVADIGTIQQMAELGVIFLLFGVGLHFSLRDLWNVHDIAIRGTLPQTGLIAFIGIGFRTSLGMNLASQTYSRVSNSYRQHSCDYMQSHW